MSKELIEKLRDDGKFLGGNFGKLMHEAADALESKAAPVGDDRGHDTKGSRKALGAMNAKLKAKIGRLEREIAAYQRAQQPQSGLTEAEPGCFVQPVPSHCDRITWRGQYYHLPIAAPQPSAGVVMPARKQLPDLMFAEFHESRGWNACLDEFARLNKGAGSHE